MAILKSIKHKPYMSFRARQRKFLNLLTRLYNLLTIKNSLKSSKQLKMIFLYMSVLSKIQQNNACAL